MKRGGRRGKAGRSAQSRKIERRREERRREERRRERRWSPSIALFTLLIPLLVVLLRHGNPLVPGSFQYAAPLVQWLGPASLVVSLLAALGVALLMLVAVQPFTRDLQFLLVLLFLANPLFLRLALTPGTLILALLTGLAIIVSKQKSFLALLQALINPLFASAFLATLYLYRRHQRVLAGLVVGILLALVRGVPHEQLRFIEFGAPFGISLLFLILAYAEASLRWREEKQTLLLLCVLSIAALWSNTIGVFLGLLSGVLTALFLHRLIRRKWQLPDAKPLALLLLGCLFLFLITTQILLLVRAEPTRDTIELLHQLPRGSVLLTEEELGPLITTFSNATPLVPQTPVVRGDVERLYHARKLRVADEILGKYGITHLLLTPRLKKQWTHDEDGLLFLLKHSEKFKKVAATRTGELWAYNFMRMTNESNLQ